MPYVNFREEVKEIRKRTKEGALDKEARIELIDGLLSAATNEPNEYELEALSDLILYEELTDKRKNKMSVEEYPIMSAIQLARRQNGVHTRQAKEGEPANPVEVPLSWAENYGTDNVDYGFRQRRERTDFENLWMDKMTQSRNKERRHTHRDFRNGKSDGVFSINIATGEKIIHDKRKYEKYFF